MTSPADLGNRLARFACTGHWGPLTMNQPLEQITRVWGQPTGAMAVRKNRAWPQLLAYGDIEISVCRCRHVDMICIQTWRESIDLPAPDTGAIETHRSSVTYEAILAALAAEGCAWEPNPQLTFGSQRALLAGPCSTGFVFDVVDDGSVILNIVSAHRPVHHCDWRPLA